jgi:hypothetical protein
MAEFSYRRAIELGCFVQVPLLSDREMSEAAAARGLISLPHAMDWEPLDRDGVLPPVAYVCGGRYVPSALHLHALDAGELVLREEIDYRPWVDEGLSPLYGHWQILTLAWTHRAMTARTPLQLLGKGVAAFRSFYSGLAETDGFLYNADDRNFELLLTRVQSFFLPRVRGTWIADEVFLADGSLADEGADAWARRMLKSTDLEQALGEVGYDREKLERTVDWALMTAERRDPLARWRVLVEAITRRQTDQLLGDALISRDFYDAANVLAMWHHAISGRNLIAESEEARGFGPSVATVNKERYGYERTRGNKAALPGVLEEFGLYPWRVVMFTEGASEIRMLEAVFLSRWGLHLDDLGIVAVDMKGSGLPTKPADRRRLIQMLIALRRFPNYFFFLFDDENTARAFIRTLEQETTGYEPFGDTPILEPDPYDGANPQPEGWTAGEYEPLHAPEKHIWQEDLEADNFSTEELCEVVNHMADEAGPPGSELMPDEVEKAFGESDKAVASVIEELAHANGFTSFRKPEFAYWLGNYAVDHPLRRGEDRPILKVAEHLRRLANAHRQLRGRLREGERIKLQRAEP